MVVRTAEGFWFLVQVQRDSETCRSVVLFARGVFETGVKRFTVGPFFLRRQSLALPGAGACSTAFVYGYAVPIQL